MNGPEFRYSAEVFTRENNTIVYQILRGNTVVLEWEHGEQPLIAMRRVRDYLNRDKREIVLAEDKIFRQKRVIENLKNLIKILTNRLLWCSENIRNRDQKGEIIEWVKLARQKRREISVEE